MSDNRKYYYLKLKENFFDSEQMIVLESLPDGHLYSNILLKLYLRSLKNEGKLMFNDRIPYNSTILAQVVRQPVGVVEKAVAIYKEFGLIEIMDNGAIYMLDIQNYIGQSSTEADRQRDYQHRINMEKGSLLTEGAECKKSNKKSCKKSNMESNRKSAPEIELDIDKDIYIVQSEKIWFLYPNKKGKSSAIDKIPKLIKEFTYEQMERVVSRYINYVEYRRCSDFKELKYQNGSTFFYKGYVDYLDENYEEETEIAATKKNYWDGIDS